MHQVADPAANVPGDAVATAEALKAGRTTIEEQILLAEQRIARANPPLNFLAFDDIQRSREQSVDLNISALAGVPILLKDHLEQRGLPNTFGAFLCRNSIAREDAPLTKAIKNAGMIPIGRSTMSEFGINVTTETRLFGITRNPWSLEHTPGGSSGGAGAAVASGAVAIAHASDGLGSIRHAAAPCNLVGLKASRGRVAGEEELYGPFANGVNGCVSRTVRDTAAWLSATEFGGSGRRFPPLGALAPRPERRLHIVADPLVLRTSRYPSAAVMSVFGLTISLLEKLGHVISDGKMPFDGPVVAAGLKRFMEGNLVKRIKAAEGEMGRPAPVDELEFRSWVTLEAGREISDEEFNRNNEMLAGAAQKYLSIFDQADMVLKPVFSTEIVRVGTFSFESSWHDHFDDLIDYAGYSWSDNYAGTPAISLPIGFDDSGLPVGMQLAAAPGREKLLLELAVELETQIEWWRHKPPIWVGN